MATATQVQATPDRVFRQAARAFEIENAEYAASDRQAPRPEWWALLADALEAAVQPKAVASYQFAAVTALVNAYLAQDFATTDRPGHAILRGWAEVQNAKEPDYAPTETPLQLMSLPSMGNEQLQRMLGLPARTIHLIQAEFAKKKNGEPHNPKLFELPDGHVTPGERDRMDLAVQAAKEFKAAVARWHSRPKFTLDDDGQPTAEDDWQPPPESVEELLGLPGMTIDQVSSMHRISKEEVQAIAAGLSRVPHDPTAPSDDLPTETIEREVRALAADEPSLTPAEIAERLGLSVDRVQTALDPPKPKKKK